MITSICPILPSRDFAVTKTFYASLGFVVTSEYPDHGYLILKRDMVELHFSHHPKHLPETSDHAAFVRTPDARALWADLQNAGHPTEGRPRVTPAEDKPWGICELAIVDPDGTLLRVGHILE